MGRCALQSGARLGGERGGAGWGGLNGTCVGANVGLSWVRLGWVWCGVVWHGGLTWVGMRLAWLGLACIGSGDKERGGYAELSIEFGEMRGSGRLE